jgi:hypothetical protein
MQYFDPELAGGLRDAFDDLVGDWPAVSRSTMFGCPSYRADGTLFAVLVTAGVALTQLDAEERAAVREAFEAGPFSPGDRTIDSWVQVAAADANVLSDLEPWVRESYETALAQAAD